MRTKYWYYISNARLLAYDITDQPSALNYVIVYANPTTLYQVNADVAKATWKVKLNNFAKVVDSPLIP